MQYFSACYTMEQAKAEYRRLAKIHHPDLGGDVQTMKEINAQYDAFQVHGNRWQAPQPTQRTYQPQPEPRKPRKPRTVKRYTVGAVQGAIDDANAKGGRVRYFDGGVIVIETPGMKIAIAIPTRSTDGEFCYSIRQYNKMPKKYAA